MDEVHAFAGHVHEPMDEVDATVDRKRATASRMHAFNGRSVIDALT